MQILSRRTKNNPVLIGEPGVGKTAIRRRAGAAHRGWRRAREPARQEAARARPGRADRGGEVSRRVRGAAQGRALGGHRRRGRDRSVHRRDAHARGGGEGRGGDGCLEPPQARARARGELHCVGATTLDEYSKHVEKDAALARRFQPLLVEEPTVEDTVSILRGIKEKYELPPRRADLRLRPGGCGAALAPLHHRSVPARTRRST